MIIMLISIIIMIITVISIIIMIIMVTSIIIMIILLQLPLLCLHLLIQPQIQHHRLLPALPALQVFTDFLLIYICLVDMYLFWLLSSEKNDGPGKHLKEFLGLSQGYSHCTLWRLHFSKMYSAYPSSKFCEFIRLGIPQYFGSKHFTGNLLVGKQMSSPCLIGPRLLHS